MLDIALVEGVRTPFVKAFGPLARVPAPDGPAYPRGVACAGDTPPHYRPDMLWVGEHLYHLAQRGQAITEPATKVAELRQLPWWR